MPKRGDDILAKGFAMLCGANSIWEIISHREIPGLLVLGRAWILGSVGWWSMNEDQNLSSLVITFSSTY